MSSLMTITRVCIKATYTKMASAKKLSCICAICKDDISTTLGKRRILFHATEGKEPINQVVRQFGAIFQVFTGRRCDISTDAAAASCLESSARWCCRRCERQVKSIYKRFEEVCQFYAQFRECPLANLLNDLCLEDKKESTASLRGSLVNQIAYRNEEIGKESREPSVEERTETPVDEELLQEASEQEVAEKEESVDTRPPKFRKLTSLVKTTKHLKSEEQEKISKSVKGQAKLNDCDSKIVSAIQESDYDTTFRLILADKRWSGVALTETAKFLAKECSGAGCEIARMSHVADNLNVPHLRKSLFAYCPNTVQFFGSFVGKDKLLTPPMITLLSVLIYALNSHANLFQKMISTILLNDKCSPSTIEKLHTYRLCIAYETLVTFLDSKIETGQIPKLVKNFQLA